MSPKCSLVIRAYNEEDHIGRLLEGIQQQTIPEIEVILVDSGSTDNTLAVAAEYSVTVVSIEPDDFTFGRSLNRGIAAANAEIVLITSAHCYPVYPDWAEKLIAPLKNSGVALSYGKQRGADSNKYSEHQWFKQYFPDVSVPNQSHAFSHNANAAVRRSLWEEHQYNENLTGLEDLAWSSWAKEQGHLIAYAAEAEVVHVHAESPKLVYNRHRREAVALKQILPESKFSLWNFLRLTSSNILSDMTQARRERVFIKNIVSILWFRLMQYWGTYRGYRFSGKIDAELHQRFYYPPGILSTKTPAERDVPPIDYKQVSDE